MFKDEELFEKSNCGGATREAFGPVHNRNRTKLRFTVRQIITSINQQTGHVQRRIEAEGIIRPQMQTAGIWFAARRTITGRITFTAQFLNGTTQTLSVNENINNNSPAYSAVRWRLQTLPVNTSASNLHFVSIDSWGDTPSSPPVTLNCH